MQFYLLNKIQFISIVNAILWHVLLLGLTKNTLFSSTWSNTPIINIFVCDSEVVLSYD